MIAQGEPCPADNLSRGVLDVDLDARRANSVADIDHLVQEASTRLRALNAELSQVGCVRVRAFASGARREHGGDRDFLAAGAIPPLFLAPVQALVRGSDQGVDLEREIGPRGFGGGNPEARRDRGVPASGRKGG